MQINLSHFKIKKILSDLLASDLTGQSSQRHSAFQLRSYVVLEKGASEPQKSPLLT